MIFDRRLDGGVFAFGVTGRLPNSDLVICDRQTESWWQQFLGEAIVGEMTGKILNLAAFAPRMPGPLPGRALQGHSAGTPACALRAKPVCPLQQRFAAISIPGRPARGHQANGACCCGAVRGACLCCATRGQLPRVTVSSARRRDKNGPRFGCHCRGPRRWQHRRPAPSGRYLRSPDPGNHLRLWFSCLPSRRGGSQVTVLASRPNC